MNYQRNCPTVPVGQFLCLKGGDVPTAAPIFMIGGETMKKSVPIFAVLATIALIAGAIVAWDQAHARARRKRRAQRRTSN